MSTLPEKIAARILEEYINDCHLGPGDRLPGVRYLQSQYEASSTTIVHAISLLEQQGIVERRHGSGCYVAQRFNEVKQSPAKTIGFIAGSMSSELIVRVYAGIESEARRMGYHVITATSDFIVQTEKEQVARLIEAKCQALVVFPAIRTVQDLQTDYLKERSEIPIVLMDMSYPEHQQSKVLFDNYQLGYDMTELLIQKGHRLIAFTHLNEGDGSLVHATNHARFKGYLAALETADIEYRPEYDCTVSSDCLHHWGEKWQYACDQITIYMDKLGEWTERPTAIVAAEDTSAMRMIRTARKMGIKVHQELQIVGFDNLSPTQHFSPPFVSSDPDFTLAGRVATRLAIRHARGDLVDSTTYMIPVPLKLGESHQSQDAASILGF